MAQLVEGDRVVTETPMQFAGEVSTFSAQLPLSRVGTFQLRILAMDAPNANFGMTSTEIVVEK